MIRLTIGTRAEREPMPRGEISPAEAQAGKREMDGRAATAWECPACGYEQPDPFDRCPKCGGASVEIVKRLDRVERTRRGGLRAHVERSTSRRTH